MWVIISGSGIRTGLLVTMLLLFDYIFLGPWFSVMIGPVLVSFPVVFVFLFMFSLLCDSSSFSE